MITITSTVEILDHTYCHALTNFFSSGSRPFGNPPELPDRPVRPWPTLMCFQKAPFSKSSVFILAATSTLENELKDLRPHYSFFNRFRSFFCLCWDTIKSSLRSLSQMTCYIVINYCQNNSSATD